MDQKDKFIADLLAKYKLALTRLDDALTKLEQQPTTLEEFAASNDALRSQLDELIQWKVRGKMFKKDNDVLRDELNTLNKDYWGRPKKIEAKPSTKNIQQDDYIKNLTKSKTGNKLK
jgi:cell shape-determining protein MreC